LFEAPYDFANGSRSLAISDRPEVRIDPTEIVGAANIQNGSSSSIANVSYAQVYSVEAAGNWGPVYFQGEYFWFNVDRRPFAQPGTTFTGPTLHFNGGYGKLGRDRRRPDRNCAFHRDE
jgi:phosphate-selective porin OprO/OprP